MLCKGIFFGQACTETRGLQLADTRSVTSKSWLQDFVLGPRPRSVSQPWPRPPATLHRGWSSKLRLHLGSGQGESSHEIIQRPFDFLTDPVEAEDLEEVTDTKAGLSIIAHWIPGSGKWVVSLQIANEPHLH